MGIQDFNLASLNGSNGFRLDGENEFDHAGWSVSDAGDVNGDGYSDFVMGARIYGLGGAAASRLQAASRATDAAAARRIRRRV